MDYEVIDCIDAGTEFCPCHLAEEGECILCSQLHGKCFCDCVNWKGVCIYEEFASNGFKAKEGRKTFTCDVIDAIEVEEGLLFIEFRAPHKLCIDLLGPGKFIFIRTNDNPFFDVPISILESDADKNIIKVLIEVRGIKTKRLLNTEIKGEITIRGPYFNGVFGIKNIDSTKNGEVLVLCRGIGLAPAVPVIKKLANEGNKVKILLDKAPFKGSYIEKYVEGYDVQYVPMNLINKGEISNEAKEFIKNGQWDLIHCAGADILTYKLIEYLNDLKDESTKVSCCNNAKMCCGEGVCGSCTARFAGHKVKRLCKVQSDPRKIFEDRRFI